jgi:hypothetical protein
MSEAVPPRASIDNAIGIRSWELIKHSWMGSLPDFGQRPVALTDLQVLQQIAKSGTRSFFADEDGSVRRAVLAEGVFLFQKCAHTHLAAQRLGMKGMHSWAMFNAYHCAYLGARGIMALLGIALPQFESQQFIIDVFPQPTTKKERQRLVAGQWEFSTYWLVHFAGQLFKQEDVWKAFRRVLSASTVSCWSGNAYEELRLLAKKSDVPVTRPRNAFLYTPTHWPLGDLLVDATEGEFEDLFGRELDTSESGFLLRLSCEIYGLFESLLSDMAKVSGPIRLELERSRIAKNPEADDLVAYNAFLKRVG